MWIINIALLGVGRIGSIHARIAYTLRMKSVSSVRQLHLLLDLATYNAGMKAVERYGGVHHSLR